MNVNPRLGAALLCSTLAAPAALGQLVWESNAGPGARFIREPFVSPVAASQETGRLPVLSSDKVFSVDKSCAPSGITGDVGDVAIKQGDKGVQRFIYEPRGRGDHEWDYKYLDGELNREPARQGGVMWLSPANDWGKSPRCGYDLRNLKPSVIRWDARCEGHDPCNVTFVVGGVHWQWSKTDKQGWAKTKVPHGDTIPVTHLGIKKLSNEWSSFECQLPDTYDFSRVVGAFGWQMTWDANGIKSAQNDKKFILEVRNVRYEVADLPRQSTDVFYIYSDADAGNNHFVPTGFMGDCGDIHVHPAWEKNPHSGKTCIRIVYDAKGKGPHRCPYPGPCKWSGLIWQHPPCNWGQNDFWKNQGYDLSGYTRLAFWARAEKNCELDFQVAGVNEAYGDSQRQPLKRTFNLKPKWTQFEIDCKPANLKHTIGGLGWVTNWDTNHEGVTFYLDEIRFLKK